MKKLHLVSVLGLAAILSASTVYADGFEIKAGAASIKDAGDKVGFDAGLAYTLRLDRFFAIMPEVNFNWLNYTGSSSGAGIGSGGFSGAASPTTNVYTMPVLLNARIYIPMGTDDTPIFQPFITLGAGYGWSSYNQSSVAASGSSPAIPSQNLIASGFMYQAVVGGLLNLGMISDGSASSTSLLLEAGYRGGILSTSTSQNLNYSGFLVRAGVNLAF